MDQGHDIVLEFELFDIACYALDNLLTYLNSLYTLDTSYALYNLVVCVQQTLNHLLGVRVVHYELEVILLSHGWTNNQFNGHIDKTLFIQDINNLYDRFHSI